jgi:hypothetical protein
VINELSQKYEFISMTAAVNFPAGAVCFCNTKLITVGVF